MAWFYLIIAGFFEIAWPVGLKIAHTHKIGGTVMAVITMIISGFFLYLAQKTIPIGTAYAVWTGIGALGTAILGIVLFAEPITIARVASLLLILSGIIGLRLAG